MESDLDGIVTERFYDNTPLGRGRIKKVVYYNQPNLGTIDANTTLATIRGLLPASGEETVSYIYDNQGRVDGVVQDFGGGSIRSTWTEFDAEGRPTKVSTSNSADPETRTVGVFQAVHYNYDRAGRVSQVRTGKNALTGQNDIRSETRYFYDQLGRLKTVVATERFNTKFSGDATYQMVDELTGQLVISGSNLRGETTQYVYGLAGQLEFSQTITKLDSGTKGVDTTYTYDSIHRLTNLANDTIGGANLSTFNYQLRDDGRRTAATETDAEGTSYFAYDYDELGRLTEELYYREDDTPAYDEGYLDKFTFDDAGNRLTLDRDYELVANDLAFDAEGFASFTGTFESDRLSSFTYDDNDRILTKTVDDDTNAEDRHTVYDWDDNGTSSTTLLGETTYLATDDQGTVETITTNEYNARGRLSQSEIDEDGNQTIETTTQFDYDNQGLRVRQTRDDGTNTETREFVFDPQNPTGYAQALEEVLVDQLGARSVDKAFTVGLDVITQALANAVTGLGAKEPGTFVYDAHGSVRQIADELGAAVQIALREVGGAGTNKIDYEAYGEAINAAIGTAITQLLYSGEFTDAVSNQQYLRARFYDIGNGRFTRADPFAGSMDLPLSLNKYSYVHGDPISAIDPSGELLAFIAAVVGGAVLGATFGALAGAYFHIVENHSFDGIWGSVQSGALFGVIAGTAIGAAVGTKNPFLIAATLGALLALNGVLTVSVLLNPNLKLGTKVAAVSLFLLNGLFVQSAIRGGLAGGTGGAEVSLVGLIRASIARQVKSLPSNEVYIGYISPSGRVGFIKGVPSEGGHIALLRAGRIPEGSRGFTILKNSAGEVDTVFFQSELNMTPHNIGGVLMPPIQAAIMEGLRASGTLAAKPTTAP